MLSGPDDLAAWFTITVGQLMTAGMKYGTEMGDGVTRYVSNTNGGPVFLYVKDGRIIDNTGNRYLCLWVTNIDGLEIRGNKVTADRHAIHILGRDRTVKNVTIADNELTAGDITVTSDKAQNITITGNRYTGAGSAHITVTNLTWVKGDNKGFEKQLHVPKSRRK